MHRPTDRRLLSLPLTCSVRRAALMALVATWACADAAVGPIEPPHAPPHVEATAPAIASLEVWPRDVLLHPGDTVALMVTAFTAAGDVHAGAQIAFEATHAEVVIANAAGKIVARREGSTTVRVSAGGQLRSIPVRVAPRRSREFSIAWELGALEDSIRPLLAPALARAAARWERVIVGDAPDLAVQLPAGFCGHATPAISGVVDDLRVIVKAVEFDGPGNTAAFTMPCVDRQHGGTAAVAMVYLDAADLPMIVQLGLLEAVLAHEVGHALGVGTRWNGGASPLVAAPLGYHGAGARGAAMSIGLTATLQAPVPVEWLPGGKDAHHWHASEMAGELMAPSVGHATPPISRVTVAALRDLGYDVEEAAASAFAPRPATAGNASRARAHAPGTIDLSTDAGTALPRMSALR